MTSLLETNRVQFGLQLELGTSCLVESIIPSLAIEGQQVHALERKSLEILAKIFRNSYRYEAGRR